MSRKLSHTTRFPFDAELVHKTVTSRTFWDTVMHELTEFTDCSIEKFEKNDDLVTIATRQVLPHDFLPPLAQSVMKFDLNITREDTYTALNSAKRAQGTFTASIPAGPGWLKGTQELYPTDSGCAVRKTAEVKVYIPFVGPKLEQLILVNLVELAKAEAEFLTTAIYKNLGLNPADYPQSYTDRSKYYQPDLGTPTANRNEENDATFKA